MFDRLLMCRRCRGLGTYWVLLEDFSNDPTTIFEKIERRELCQSCRGSGKNLRDLPSNLVDEILRVSKSRG